MTIYIKDFLKSPDVQDMININNFIGVYAACPMNMRGYLTDTLIAAHIDPCLYFCNGETIAWMFYHGNDIKEYSVPNNISYINMDTFAFSDSLRKIILPKSIKMIDDSSFFLSSVTEIIYLGSKEDFKTIAIHSRAFYKSSITSIQCCDGSIEISSLYS